MAVVNRASTPRGAIFIPAGVKIAYQGGSTEQVM
jgi:hypothetical protein